AGSRVRLGQRLAGSEFIVHSLLEFRYRKFAPGPKNTLFAWLERVAARCTDFMLYTSDTIREAAVRHRIGRVERTVVVGGPIADLGRFEASEREVAALRSELALRPGEPVVACVSRLVDYKGIDTLLRAAGLVAPAQPNVRFVVMGGGPLETRLRAMAGDLGLADRVVFTGFRRDERDVIRLLALADLFCLPPARGFRRGVRGGHGHGLPTGQAGDGSRNRCRGGRRDGVTGPARGRPSLRGGDAALAGRS